ncbi:MAG: hypothetical protein FWD05_07265 [Oscillospiraceae bacterium]|nr:hypothetical protein [Oscillospiraceae bacterium]
MKKKILKLTIIVLIVILLAQPIQVSACPHFDQYGRMYFLLFNEDFTRGTYIFFMESYLHHQEVLLYDMSVVFSEAFELTFRRFIHHPDADFDGYDYIEPEYEFTQSWFVSGINFNLEIGLVNTLQFAYEGENETHVEMNYLVSVTRLNDRSAILESLEIYDIENVEIQDEQMLYELLHEEISYEDVFDLIEVEGEPEDVEFLNNNNWIMTNGLNQVVPEILRVGAGFSYRDIGLYLRNNTFYTLHDPIEIAVFNSDKLENVVAVDISRDAGSVEKINVIYNEIIGAYVFTIYEPGTFIIVENDFDIESVINVPDKFMWVPSVRAEAYDTYFSDVEPEVEIYNHVRDDVLEMEIIACTIEFADVPSQTYIEEGSILEMWYFVIPGTTLVVAFLGLSLYKVVNKTTHRK